MGIFSRLDRATSRVADRMHAVSAVVDCMKSSPNGRPEPDPDRGEIVLRGIFDEVSVHQPVEIGKRDGAGNDLRALVNGTELQFSVDCARYPAAKDVRQGDWLTLDDTRRFDILSVKPDGLSRIVFRLLAA